MNNNNITSQSVSSSSSSSNCSAPFATARIPAPTTVGTLSSTIEPATKNNIKTNTGATNTAATDATITSANDPTSPIFSSLNDTASVANKPAIDDPLTQAKSTTLTTSGISSKIGTDHNSHDSNHKLSSRQKVGTLSTVYTSGSLSSSSSSSSSTSSSSISSSGSSSVSSSGSSSNSSAPSSTSTSPDVDQEKNNNHGLPGNKVNSRDNGKNLEDVSSNRAISDIDSSKPIAKATIAATDGLKLKIQTTSIASSSVSSTSNTSSMIKNKTSQQASDFDSESLRKKSSNNNGNPLIENPSYSGSVQLKTTTKTSKDSSSIGDSKSNRQTSSNLSISDSSSTLISAVNGGRPSRDSNTMSGQQQAAPNPKLSPIGGKSAAQNKDLSAAPTILSSNKPPQRSPPQLSITQSTLSLNPTQSPPPSSKLDLLTTQRQSPVNNQTQITGQSKKPSDQHPPTTPSSTSGDVTTKGTSEKIPTLGTGAPAIDTSPAPKPKATRTRKTPATNKNAPATASLPTTNPRKAEPAKRSTKATRAKQASSAAASSLTAATTSGPTEVPGTQNRDFAQTKQAGLSLSTTSDNTKTSPPSASKKRKPRSASNDSKTQPEIQSTPPASNTPAASPPKRSRKKKTDQVKLNDSAGPTTQSGPPTTSTQHILTYGAPNPQLLSVASGVGMSMPSSAIMTNTSLPTQPPLSHLSQSSANRQLPSLSPLDIQQHASQDPTSRYFSLTISPYSNCDYTNAASLTRPSLSRLFTSSSSSSAGPELQPPLPPATSSSAIGSLGNQQIIYQHPGAMHVQPSDEIAKAFEELRDNSWSHLSKCILEQAQQFDIPSLIGTLYTIRSENEKLVNKVRDLTMKREQLLAINARLDLPGPMLNQHLSHTSPNFTSVVAGITNSPKSLPNSSPSPAMNKSPLVPGGSYANHLTTHAPPPPPHGSLGLPNFIDRNSPLIGVTTPHPAGGVSGLKSSTISTPSPPTGALLAHGANNRTGLMTINNSPYMSNLHPSINALNQLGPNPPSSSYYPRQ